MNAPMIPNVVPAERVRQMTFKQLFTYCAFLCFITVLTVVTNYATEADILNRLLHGVFVCCWWLVTSFTFNTLLFVCRLDEHDGAASNYGTASDVNNWRIKNCL
jgi:hypothetical protein